MVTGFFDEYRQPTISILIQGHQGERRIEAVIDTGFDGSVCLPIPLAIQLGLELCGAQVIELADGSQSDELVFTGTVTFDDEIRTVEIALTESDDALIGTELLRAHKLEIGFLTQTIRLEDERGHHENSGENR